MFKNKFKKIINKKSTGIIITVLTFVVVFCAIFANSNLTIAADSLPGIVDIRNEITDSNAPYRVLEIVPSRDVAQFGFMVSGQEPLDATTLYNSTTNKWMSWQEYLTLHSEDQDAAWREAFMDNLANANLDYVNMGSQSADKPMWYVDYQEVDASYTGDKNVISGGTTPVYGWIVSNDLAPSNRGWNVKFTKSDDDVLLEEAAAAEKPYYMIDPLDPTAVTDITEANLMAGNVYPEKWYVYKLDASGGYVPSMTIGELKALCDENPGLYTTINEYKILKFRLFTETDAASGPYIYEASDFAYLREDSASKVPYIIEPWISGDKKGHNLVKPSFDIYYTGGFYSNEWFKQYSLDIDADQVNNYNVEVLTMTAGEIGSGMSREELTSFLSTIDFIYINPGKDGSKYLHNDSSFDLDEEAVEVIFEKICNEKTPCIVDYSLRQQGILDSNFSDTKVHALAVMLMQNEYRNLLTTGQYKNLTNVATWVNTIVATNNHNYVNENVMVINSTVAGYDLLDNYHITKYASAVVEDAYSAVLDEIELENMYRLADSTSGYAELSTDIYKSTVVRYIMHFTSEREIEKKTSINVLEIQPANVKYPDNNSGNGSVSDIDNDYELTPERIRKWMGADSSVKVNITTMNTMEFIGTIEDLNSEYDLIYIGSDISGLPQRKSQSKGYMVPDYKEVNKDNSYDKNLKYDSMDYLVYSNVGGLTNVNAQFAGHLETDLITDSKNTFKNTVLTRYNGNDITADKHNELVDYVKGTYPVVVSDMLCASRTAPHPETVDNCTFLYSFLEKHLSKNNVFLASEVESGKNSSFKFYVNRGKLDIGQKVVLGEESTVKGRTAFVQPGTYMTGSDTTERHVTYIEKENNKYYLKYKFTITNDGAVFDSTKYSAALYLDSNSDGKFSLEYEKLPDIVIHHVASGNVVENGKLVAGEQYSLSREVPETYSGVLTWKVEVSQTDNKFIRDSVTGYTRLKGTQTVTIKVLQVRRDGGVPLVLETAIGNAAGAGTNNTLNALVWGGYCEADGITYEGIKDDFRFEFTTMTNKQFNEAYTAQTLNLMSYDMVVLGFYDSYNLKSGTETDINFDAVNGAGGLKEYIDSGKSVLFAHDTTSVTVVPDYNSYFIKKNDQETPKIYTDSYSANVWGYNLNMYIRDMVGLDTYGITTGVKNNVDYDLINSGKDLSTSTAGKKLMADLKNELDAEGYYKIGLKPLAYLPRSNKTKTVGQTQGFAYAWLDWNWKQDEVTYRAVRSKYNTDRAERVNEGQITTYPYYLDETIDITRTHHQYFTLDLSADDDGDGETDLVVWYTMGGKVGDNSHQDSLYSSNEKEGYSTSRESNFDDTSEKDVMSNYYIYNKGNITYTGFGDFDNTTWLERADIVEECKLFVNTLVAAYNASVKDPQITVYESEENLVPATTFYEYGDADNNVAFRENTLKMYFTVNDMNVIRGTKSATAEYFVKLKDSVSVSGSSYTVSGVTYPVFKDGSGNTYLQLNNLKTYKASGGEVSASNLACGEIYYVVIPTDVFEIVGVKGQNVNTFMVGSKTVLKKTGSLTGKVTTVETARTFSTVEFVHVELFPLD